MTPTVLLLEINQIELNGTLFLPTERASQKNI